jgi:hypothetical protein
MERSNNNTIKSYRHFLYIFLVVLAQLLFLIFFRNGGLSLPASPKNLSWSSAINKTHDEAEIKIHGNESGSFGNHEPAATAATTVTSIEHFPTATPRKVYDCGWDVGSGAYLFPEFLQAGKWTRDSLSDVHDIVMFGMHGPCDGMGNNKVHGVYMRQHFPGKTLFVDGEAYGNIVTESSSLERLYQIGPVEDSHPHSMRVYYMAVLLMSKPDQWNWIFDHAQKQRNNGQYNAISYMTSNCVPFRQQAAAKLSEIVELHYGGGCQINTPNSRKANAPPIKGARIHANSNFYRNFKYCLVMENRAYSGYITEKLLDAFFGGCLPIYYGTQEVFDIFNPNAFLFYDIENPQPVLDQIRYLEQNASAYKERLDHPILRHGNQTVEEYFSLTDEVGNGTLKRKIRAMMGIV